MKIGRERRSYDYFLKKAKKTKAYMKLQERLQKAEEELPGLLKKQEAISAFIKEASTKLEKEEGKALVYPEDRNIRHRIKKLREELAELKKKKEENDRRIEEIKELKSLGLAANMEPLRELYSEMEQEHAEVDQKYRKHSKLAQKYEIKRMWLMDDMRKLSHYFFLRHHEGLKPKKK